MKFLIDECLHTSLIGLAHDTGHLCDHVNFLGLGGQKDWRLMRKFRDEDYTFVTNNRSDFDTLYAQEQLHAGLVIIIPNVTPSRQRSLFHASLLHIGARSDERNCGSGLCGHSRDLPRVSVSKPMKDINKVLRSMLARRCVA